MKKCFLTIAALGFALPFFGQNIFPLPSGNTGIGNTSPTAMLDVSLSTNFMMTKESGIRISYPIPALPPFGGPPVINESIFEVRQFTFGSNYRSRFVVKTNGNVGVGVSNTDPLLNSTRMVVTDGIVSKVDLNVKGFSLIDGEQASMLFGALGTPKYGEWGLEYNNSGSIKGLNFWKPNLSNNFGNYFLFLTDQGDVAINTNDPDSKFHLEGGHMTIQGNQSNSTWNTWNTRIASPLNSAWVTTTPNTEGDYMNFGMTESGWFFGYSPRQIGHTSPTDIKYAMSVGRDGLLTAREIKVTLSGWSDFVFADDYQLQPLSEVKEFIEENNHLPNVPSEKEVLENGTKLGEMDAILLQKIEELTLYVIQQNEKIEVLQEQNKSLQSVLKK